MNIGIMTYADDKSKQRCSDAECTANLLEFILDILEPFLKKHAPSQWSIIIADHIDRDLQSKFAASFIEKTDSVIREIPKKIAKETDLTVINRLKRVVSRYEQLRPLALDRQKIDDSIVRILKIYRSITN